MDSYDIFKKLRKGTKFSQDLSFPMYTRKEPVLNSFVKLKSQEGNNVKEDLTKADTIKFLSEMNHGRSKGMKRKGSDENELGRKKCLLEKEEVNHYRNVNNISVVGRRVSNPFRFFEEFEVDKDIIENLRKCGYEEPTAIQKQAVPIMLQGRQLLACAPTGSGKTAAFLVPLIQNLKGPLKQGFRALILCPTRELASQTQRECLKLAEGRGFKVHVISKIKKAMTQYGSRSNQKFDILITTPNRLCFLLKQDPPAINLANVEWLVIDEADKLFEGGSRSFRDQLEQILGACTRSERKIAMFSATHTPVVAKWSVHNMPKLIRVTVGQRNAATDTVDQELLFVGSEQGKLLALRDLFRQALHPPVLVFVQSKERAQQLFAELIYDGIRVDAIHADRTQTQRDNTVRSFREGRIWVLICTELMARGVDFKGVNLVINYDFPQSTISYVHRIGRAGRAGRTGKAITFFTLEDTDNLRSIAHVLKESGCDVPDYMLSIKKKSKRDGKKMARNAPVRDDIVTIPLYDRIKGGRRRKFLEIGKRMAAKDRKTNADGKHTSTVQERRDVGTGADTFQGTKLKNGGHQVGSRKKDSSQKMNVRKKSVKL